MPPPGVEAPLPWTADPHAEGRAPEEHAGVGRPIAVAEPADERQRYIIDMLASYVIKDGCTFEQVGSWSGAARVGTLFWLLMGMGPKLFCRHCSLSSQHLCKLVGQLGQRFS